MLLRRTETTLLALAALFVAAAFVALSIAPAVRSGQWGAARFTAGYLVSVAAWVGVAAMGHVALSRRLPNRDPLIFPIIMLLTGWGLALIWRLAPAFGLRQTAWLVVGLVGLLAVAFAPGDLRWLRRYRYLWLTASLALTALTLLFGINPSGGGEALWLGCCGVYFQPSEALKLLFVVYLAAYFAEKLDRPDSALHGRAAARPEGPQREAGGEAIKSTLATLGPVLLVWGFSLVLLVSQRDLGTGSLIFAVFIALLYLATGRRRYLVIGALLLAVGAAISYQLFGVVRLRVDSWLNPFADPSGRSFQMVQSLIAIASGGLFGRGFGIGAPTVIPVVHSDFIYSAIAEEWGALGALAVLALLAALVQRSLRIALRARGNFRPLLAGGLAALMALQSIFIIGGVSRALPLTGVTLPYLSYGGSSLLIQFVVAGLLLKLSHDAA